MHNTERQYIDEQNMESAELDAFFEFYRILRLLTRKSEFYRDSKLKDLGLSGAQMYVLWAVYKLGQCTYTELAHHNGLATNTVSPLVKVLVELEFVLQIPDPRDGRVTRLKLSSVGQGIVQRITEVMDNPSLQAASQVLRMVQEEPCNGLNAVRNVYLGLLSL